MTLLQIDKGVDTGPIYGFFPYPYDERRESYIVIQARTVLDNLDAIRSRRRCVRYVAPSSARTLPQQPRFARYVSSFSRSSCRMRLTHSTPCATE